MYDKRTKLKLQGFRVSVLMSMRRSRYEEFKITHVFHGPIEQV